MYRRHLPGGPSASVPPNETGKSAGSAARMGLRLIPIRPLPFLLLYPLCPFYLSTPSHLRNLLSFCNP